MSGFRSAIVLQSAFTILLLPALWGTRAPLVAAQIERPTIPPKGPVRQTPEKTTAGMIVRADLRRSSQITYPPPPGQHDAENRIVGAWKGQLLLIVHFELSNSGCALLNRDLYVVKDEKGKTYRYGGWRVEDAQFSLCQPPLTPPLATKPIIGPWMNELWDPIGIRPELGTLDLVYLVDAGASKFTFTDGKVTVELDKVDKH